MRFVKEGLDRWLLLLNLMLAAAVVVVPIYTVTDDGAASQSVALFAVWAVSLILSSILTLTAFVSWVWHRSRVALLAVVVGLIPWVMVLIIAEDWLSRWAGGRAPFYRSD